MKVLLKILKKNVRNSIVCFMSTILAAIILFVFLGVKELVLGTMSMEERVRSQQGVAIQTYMYILLFIGLILISYTVSNYSRIRIKDYGMFMVFGEEKKDIIRMIILEYGIICGISWLIGCVLGTPFVILLQSIFRKEGIQTVQDPCWFLKNIGSTCFYMCVILCIAVIMNIIKIQNNSLASLLNTEQKRGTVPSVKASVIGAVAGLICFVFAIILFSKVPMTYPRMKYGVLFSLTGLYLWFTYLGNVILRWVKKKEKWYDRYILTLKTLYHRFSENKNIILIVFIINVFVWVIVNINIIEYGNLSSEYLWKYPYNYVCMTEEKYTDEIHKVIKEPDEKIDEYAYIPLISNDGGEYVGISEDSYNKLTKNKKEHIKQGEVKAVLEKSKQDDENMFQDKHVYLKTATGMRKFAIKKEVKEVLFVAQQSDIIRILVMNNSDFDMLRSLQKKNTVIMTQQTEKETAIDEGKLKVCEKKYEIIGFYKGSLMKEDRQDDLTTLIFYICIGAFLIISGIMILSIKIWSDISNVSMKYGFLKKIGMETKEIKKNVKKELSLSLWIVFILSIVISGGALSYITWNVDWLLKKQVLITFFVLLLFQAGYIILLREYGWRLVKQQIQGERRGKDMEVISGEKIVKNYGKFEVLKGIGLNVQDGEFVGIIGKSGSGKTTLLKILGLIESVTDGTLLYKKNEISKLSDKELARIRREELGFVFQEFYLMDSLDVFENIMLPFYISKTVDDSKKERARVLMEKFGIRTLEKKMPNELSGGERQRVAICRALINDPEIVFADEPTGNLDSKSGKIVIESLKDINEHMGKTIIMVTHDPQMASYCSRLILLKDGVILEDLENNRNQESFYQEILGKMKEL